MTNKIPLLRRGKGKRISPFRKRGLGGFEIIPAPSLRGAQRRGNLLRILSFIFFFPMYNIWRFFFPPPLVGEGQGEGDKLFSTSSPAAV